jgi:hypothetical protein
MRRRPSDSLYRRLTPTERHRLALDAFGRGDCDEVRRLSDTCPEHKYWCQDPNYAERMKASLVVALSASNYLFRAALALEPAVSAEEMNSAFIQGLEQIGSDVGEELRQSEEALVIRRAYADRAAQLIGVRDGIRRFSDEIGVPAEKLLGLEKSCVATWEFASELAEIHSSDDATANFVHRSLVRTWNAFVPMPETPADVSAQAV